MLFVPPCPPPLINNEGNVLRQITFAIFESFSNDLFQGRHSTWFFVQEKVAVSYPCVYFVKYSRMVLFIHSPHVGISNHIFFGCCKRDAFADGSSRATFTDGSSAKVGEIQLAGGASGFTMVSGSQMFLAPSC